MRLAPASGPLKGVRIVELGGIGPAPFCAMLLADMGADVIRIDRITQSDHGFPVDQRFNVMQRGRRSLGLDLKAEGARRIVERLILDADGLIEGFRPGAAERLGLGPDDCHAINARLAYGRMTGYGQTGPLSQAPGHDINYIALSGALHAMGARGGSPAIPLNLVGDFGGGALYLAFGMVCAILEARRSGKGQVVDAAMLDGATSLMTMIYGLVPSGYWTDERGANRLDSGAPWYNVYETKDGRHVALGSNEPRFYRETLRLLGLEGEDLPDQHDKESWPRMKALFAEIFRTRTRDEWCAAAEGRELCLSPVLSLGEAPLHPQQKARNNFVEVDGLLQPAPAPRFSRTPAAVRGGVARPGEHSAEILDELGFSEAERASFRASGAIV
jgi:alpha-methylacyl-CoA racemase